MTSTATMSSLTPKKHKPTKSNSKILSTSLASIDQLDADTLVIGLCEDIRPLKGAAGFVDWRMCGEISNLIRNQSFQGQAGETLLMSGRGRLSPVRIILMGWGLSKNLEQEINPRCAQIIQTVEKAASKKIAVALPEPCDAILGTAQQILELALGDKLIGVFEAEGPL